MTINKKDLTEAEIRTRFITTAIKDTAGWNVNNIWEEFLIDAGQIYPSGQKGKRGKKRFADYVLESPKGNKPLSIVESKKNTLSVGAGMQQAIAYARVIDWEDSKGKDKLLEAIQVSLERRRE